MNKAHIAHHPHLIGAPSGRGGLHRILEGVLSFTRKNTVMVIALVLAAATSVIVPPDAEYLGYFDFKTLTCLFCVLAVVCALKNIRFFYMLAQQIVRLFKNARMCVLALVYVTFIGSMLIANDMALLTFLPLGFFVLSYTGMQKYMAFKPLDLEEYKNYLTNQSNFDNMDISYYEVSDRSVNYNFNYIENISNDYVEFDLMSKCKNFIIKSLDIDDPVLLLSDSFCEGVLLALKNK